MLLNLWMRREKFIRQRWRGRTIHARALHAGRTAPLFAWQATQSRHEGDTACRCANKQHAQRPLQRSHARVILADVALRGSLQRCRDRVRIELLHHLEEPTMRACALRELVPADVRAAAQRAACMPTRKDQARHRAHSDGLRESRCGRWIHVDDIVAVESRVQVPDQLGACCCRAVPSCGGPCGVAQGRQIWLEVDGCLTASLVPRGASAPALALVAASSPKRAGGVRRQTSCCSSLSGSRATSPRARLLAHCHTPHNSRLSCTRTTVSMLCSHHMQRAAAQPNLV